MTTYHQVACLLLCLLHYIKKILICMSLFFLSFIYITFKKILICMYIYTLTARDCIQRHSACASLQMYWVIHDKIVKYFERKNKFLITFFFSVLQTFCHCHRSSLFCEASFTKVKAFKMTTSHKIIHKISIHFFVIDFHNNRCSLNTTLRVRCYLRGEGFRGSC